MPIFSVASGEDGLLGGGGRGEGREVWKKAAVVMYIQ
jgi:hypothetical protein